MIENFTTFAAGFMTALAIVIVLALPGLQWVAISLGRSSGQLREAQEIIQAQQDDIDSLFEITPLRLPNGRFAKRQEKT